MLCSTYFYVNKVKMSQFYFKIKIVDLFKENKMEQIEENIRL